MSDDDDDINEDAKRYDDAQREACQLLGKIYGDHEYRIAVISLMRQIAEDMEARRPEPKTPAAPVLVFSKPAAIAD
jgi:hypothetical protein